MAGLGGNPHGKNTVFKLDDLAGSIADVSKLLASSGLNQTADRPVTKTFQSHARRTKVGLQDGGTIPISGEWRKTALVDVHGKTTRILFDRYSIAADLKNTTLRRSVDIPALSTYPDGGPSFVRRPNVGSQDGSLNLNGYFNAAVGKVDDVLTNAKAATNAAIISIAAEGFTIGNLVDMGKFQVTGYNITASTETSTEVSADLASDDVQDLGIALRDDLVAENVSSGTVNNTSVDETAQTLLGWVAHLHLKTYTGYTNVTIKIQDSADNTAFADLTGATFGAVTGVTELRIEGAATATVRQYVRAVITTVGSGSVNYAVAFSRRGYTYGSAATHRHICGLFGKAATSTWEIGFEGSAAGANKKSGECRLLDLEITYPVDGDTTFSGSLVIDGAVAQGVWP